MRRFLIGLALLAILLIVATIWLSSRGKHEPSPATNTAVVTSDEPTQANGPDAGGSWTLGQRTKSRSCVSAKMLPAAACTPGAVLTTDASIVCRPGYSGGVRDVTTSTKNVVYAAYGVVTHTTGQYEVDHMISLELGGSNNIANLWPEPAEPAPGFHEKDRVENYLHQQVCSGAMSLLEAQYEIATDW